MLNISKIVRFLWPRNTQYRRSTHVLWKKMREVHSFYAEQKNSCLGAGRSLWSGNCDREENKCSINNKLAANKALRKELEGWGRTGWDTDVILSIITPCSNTASLLTSSLFHQQNLFRSGSAAAALPLSVRNILIFIQQFIQLTNQTL